MEMSNDGQRIFSLLFAKNVIVMVRGLNGTWMANIRQ